MFKRMSYGNLLLASAALAACLVIGVEGAAAFRGGFGGFRGGGFGGFHGGGFGGFHGGGFHGFGGGGGSTSAALEAEVRDLVMEDLQTAAPMPVLAVAASAVSITPATSLIMPMRSNRAHPEYQHNASQFQQTHPDDRQDAQQLQQNRSTEANDLQQTAPTKPTRCSRTATTMRATCRSIAPTPGTTTTVTGAAITRALGSAPVSRSARRSPCLPAAAAAISVAGNPYYYANGVYYAPQGGQYAVVPPPQGAVVAAPPPSCSTVYVSGVANLDCGGAFYAPVSTGYKVIPPPVGSTVTRCQTARSTRTSKARLTSPSAGRFIGRSTVAAVSFTRWLQSQPSTRIEPHAKDDLICGTLGGRDRCPVGRSQRVEPISRR